MPNHNQQLHLKLNDGGQFVRCVADALVVCDGDATLRPTVFQPLLVGAIRLKQVVVSFYLEAGTGQYRWEFLPEVAVGEVAQAQAARRSYSTASSISATVSS